jgi:hypothetical protein
MVYPPLHFQHWCNPGAMALWGLSHLAMYRGGEHRFGVSPILRRHSTLLETGSAYAARIFCADNLGLDADGATPVKD